MVEDEVKMERRRGNPCCRFRKQLGAWVRAAGVLVLAALPSGISVAEGKDTDCRFLARQNCTTSAARCRE